MFPKIEDWSEFKNKVKTICDLIMLAVNNLKINNFHLISVDEKPSIQALERKELPLEIGKPARRETEYKRNGKTCLIAGSQVTTGKLVSHCLTEKNDENAFVAFIIQTVLKFDKKDKIVFLLDNLRTHYTASLVECIASLIGYSGSLGKKRRYGILHNMQSRKAFLENTNHRIYFVYTPKHCSWLNPIENWFSILQRRVINGGNFRSVQDLKTKINAYIDYHNSTLFRRINWQFTGFTTDKPIAA